MADMNINPEELLPHWAGALAHGQYMIPGASLPTRDGRRTGNACVLAVGWSYGMWIAHCMTDAGNTMALTLSELRTLFYPPVYIMHPQHKLDFERRRRTVVLYPDGTGNSARRKE
jgi:hypothetical protein